jgi:autotransporter-associated beta strand protein
LFFDSGASTYTGATTIDATSLFYTLIFPADLFLTGTGSIADSSNVIDNGIFDIAGTTAGASITTLSGDGVVSLGAQRLTLTNASGTFSGVLTEQSFALPSGTGGGLTIASGTETLTGTNTYTGATTIDLGATLELGNGGATGTVAGAVVDNGLVQFDYSGAATLPGAFSGTGSAELIAGTLVVGGSGVLGGTVTIDNGATMQWGAGAPGFLVGGGNAVIDNGALVMNFGGGGVGGAIPISGIGSVEIQSGSFTDSGASTYTGATTIDAAGLLALSGAGSIADSASVTDNGKFDISGTTGGASIITLTGSGGVSLGAQTLTLTNASGTFSGVLADGGISGGAGGGLAIAAGTETLTGTNTYTGATTIDLGATLKLGAGGATGTVAGAVVDDGLVQFDYSGTATLPGAFSGTGSAELIAGTLVVGGSGVLGGTVTIDNGATMQWGAGAPGFLVGGGNALVDNGALVMNFGGGGVGGAIPISGTGTVEVQSGSFSDSGASTYTGATTIDAAGLLALSGAGSIADSANVIDNGKFDISGTTGGSSIISLSGLGGVSLGAQTLTLTNASGTFSGVLADGGISGGTGGKLTIVAGTETLSGVNTYTGLTTIDIGATLDLVGVGSIADSGDPLVNGTFDISGVSGGGTSVVSLSGAGQVILGANTLTLSNAADLFSGVISGTGGLTIGAGGEILTGANTYTGATLIDTGAALQLGDGAGLHVLAGPITDNGVLVFDGGAASNVVYSQVIAGSGALTLASGTLGLTGTNTFTGVTTINTGATLQFGEDTATGTVAGNVVDNGAVVFDYSGAATMPGAFSGTGSADVVAGTVIVTAGSALGGTVTIDGGATMQWGDGAAAFLVGGGGGVVDNGALVMNFGAGSVGGSIPISGTGSVEVQSGEFGDSGPSTYTGVTTIDTAGVLALSGGGSIADSSNLIDNGKFDISGTTGGASIITLSGAGGVSLGAQTLTLTNASGTFSGVLADGGIAGGAGGGLTVAAGTETLTGANTFTGLTTIKGGATLNIGAGGATGSLVGPVLDKGTLNLDRTDTLTFAQSISGAGALNQVGTGTTVLDAVNPFTGLATVSAGVLEVGDAAHAGATLGGNVMVGAGGTLMGHGTIAGSVTNFGVVAPGGAIGTLTVGSYTQAVTGTLNIEVSPTAASLLNAIGSANLAGKLALTFDPGTYSAAHIYQIVAGHPVTGTFSATGVTGSPSGEAFGVVYQPTQVDLVTEATANAEVYGAVSAATLDRAQNFATLVEDRFGDATCPDGSTDKSAPGCQGFGAWAFAIGSWSNQGANGGALGFHNDGAGVIGGIDRSWENGSLVGAAFGYAHNNLDMTAGGAKASGPSYYGAIYGRLVAEGGLWFDGQAFYMHSGWSVDRAMPGFGVASASPNADSEGFLLQASAPIGDTALRPYGRITYVFSNRGGALEQGAGPLGFQINSASQSAAVGEVGLQYAPTFTTRGGIVLRPALEVGVQENGGDRGQVISGSLDGLPGSAFNEAGPRLWGVAGVVDGSLKVRVNQSFELFGDVRGRFGDHQTDGVASIGGVFRF